MDAVICATGYRRGLEPLVGHLSILDEQGVPRFTDGALSDARTPGLHFAGFAVALSGSIRQGLSALSLRRPPWRRSTSERGIKKRLPMRTACSWSERIQLRIVWLVALHASAA